MSEVIQFKRQEEWQFTVDVYRRPDGILEARLMDARTSLIEAGSMSSYDKLQQIIGMLETSIQAMRANAEMIKEPSHV